jgi:hypothetical protein
MKDDKMLSDYLKVLMEVETYYGTKRNGAIKYAVACHPGTPADILDLFVENKKECSSSDYLKIKYAVAANPNTSIQTLFKLSKNSGRYIIDNVKDHAKWKDPAQEETIKELELFYLLEQELKSRFF